MTSDHAPDRAARRHLMTYREFQDIVRDIDAPALGFHSDMFFNFTWSVPSFQPQPDALYAEWTGLVVRSFTPVYRGSDFRVLARPLNLPLVPPRSASFAQS